MTKNIILCLCVVANSLLVSCNKERINPSDCTGNACKIINISGKVKDMSANLGMKNIDIKAHFYQWKSTCFICLGEPVETFANTISDDLGNFNFNIIVDTGVFNESHHYKLAVHANGVENYLSGSAKYLNKYQDNFSNLLLTKYKKTKLNITFKRDSADTFYSYFSYFKFKDDIANEIIDPIRNPFFIKPYSNIMQDTTIQILTGENFTTKIIGQKHSYNNILSEKVDSIYCTNNLNTILIKY